MVEIFREVRRVLRKDGTLWLNLGDSYNSIGHKKSNSGYGSTGLAGGIAQEHSPTYRENSAPGLKHKDLCGIPWSIAKALQAPYYTGRIRSELDRVWLAATIDAEGTICGFHHERKDGDGIRTGVHIAITNTNRVMLDNAFRIWPTSKDQHNTHGKGHFGKLDIWRWIAHDVDQLSLLMSELYPYLIAKKKQCLLAYNFFELSKNAKRLGKGGEAEATRGKRSVLIHAISKLNHLQPSDIPSWCVEPPSLYEQGWFLRQDLIWSKPNPMPESVTDRCTKSHEYLFLLTKSARYFYDAEAIKEGGSGRTPGNRNYKYDGLVGHETKQGILAQSDIPQTDRNKRSVWTVATAPYPEAHFATYPPDLIKPCIMAGTSAKGCCAKCGAPWERVMKVERESSWNRRKYDGHVSGNNTDSGAQQKQGSLSNSDDRAEGGFGLSKVCETIGWQPTCECAVWGDKWTEDNWPPIPCTVLDCFAGSGTTGAVALELGRKAILIELNPKYIELIEARCNVTPGLALA